MHNNKYMQGQMAAATSGSYGNFRLSQKTNHFRWWCIRRLCKSIHFWRRYSRKTIFIFSFPVTLTFDL